METEQYRHFFESAGRSHAVIMANFLIPDILMHLDPPVLVRLKQVSRGYAAAVSDVFENQWYWKSAFTWSARRLAADFINRECCDMCMSGCKVAIPAHCVYPDTCSQAREIVNELWDEVSMMESAAMQPCWKDIFMRFEAICRVEHGCDFLMNSRLLFICGSITTYLPPNAHYVIGNAVETGNVKFVRDMLERPLLTIGNSFRENYGSNIDTTLIYRLTKGANASGHGKMIKLIASVVRPDMIDYASTVFPPLAAAMSTRPDIDEYVKKKVFRRIVKECSAKVFLKLVSAEPHKSRKITDSTICKQLANVVKRGIPKEISRMLRFCEMNVGTGRFVRVLHDSDTRFCDMKHIIIEALHCCEDGDVDSALCIFAYPAADVFLERHTVERLIGLGSREVAIEAISRGELGRTYSIENIDIDLEYPTAAYVRFLMSDPRITGDILECVDVSEDVARELFMSKY